MRRLVKILVQLKNRPLRVHVFDKDVITIGRDPSSDIFLDNPAVSRNHSRVLIVRDGCEVEDMQSSNGTLLNGMRVARKRITNGDEIGIAKFSLKVQLEIDKGNPGDPLPTASFPGTKLPGTQATSQAPVAGFSDIPDNTQVFDMDHASKPKG